MRRREFLLVGSVGLGGMVLATLATLAPAAAAAQDKNSNPQSATPQDKKRYVCPPCGCSHDGQEHDLPGRCPVCGMALVETTSLSEVAGIANFWKVNNFVWTGGQPTMEQLAKLKSAGVKAIINLRPPSEGDGLGVREAARVKELGVAYVNIPVAFGSLRPEAVDEFLKVTDSELSQPGKGPVFIHCAAAVRVGGFWMIRRVLRDGWNFDTALQEANRIGLGNQPQLVEFAKQYIAKHWGLTGVQTPGQGTRP